METIKFSYNWNKKLENTCFTTIRLQNSKYKIGEIYTIQAKGITDFEGKIIDIKHLYLNEISEFIARIDTGYSKEKCTEIIRTMYKKSVFDWTTQKLSFILIERQK